MVHRRTASLDLNSNTNEEIQDLVPNSAPAFYKKQQKFEQYMSYLADINDDDIKKMTDSERMAIEEFCKQYEKNKNAVSCRNRRGSF